MPIKIVINTRYGGFGISDLAVEKYMERTQIDLDSRDGPHWMDRAYCLDRDDPHLVAIVEELGALANGPHARLKIVEIPDGTKWQIEENDGKEWISEVHKIWR